MNLFNNLKVDMKNKRIYFALITVFILIYSLANYILISSSDDKAVINIISSLDGQGGIIGDVSFIYLYTPILLFGINSHIINSEREDLIVKMKNRKNIFHRNIIFILASSISIALLSTSIGYLIGSIYAGGFEKFWPKNSMMYQLPTYVNLNIVEVLNSIPIYIVILKIFFMKFIGFFMVGSFILILKSFIKNSGILGVVILIIPFIDFTFFNGILFINKFSLTIESWVNTGDFIMNILYLVFLIIAFYLIGIDIYKNKDFMRKGY